MSLVISNALRFVPYLASGDHLERLDVNLGHIPFCECDISIYSATLMAIGGYVNIPPVCGKFAVVGYIFCLSHTFPIGRDELDDVAPVYRYGYKVVAYLNDVVGSIAKFAFVDIPEPLVADNPTIFKVGDFTIVGLPVAFVQQNNALLGLYVAGDSAKK